MQNVREGKCAQLQIFAFSVSQMLSARDQFATLETFVYNALPIQSARGQLLIAAYRTLALHV